MQMKPNMPNMGMGGEQQTQMNLNVLELDNLRCENCNNQVFQPLFVIKKVSALQSPSGKESLAPMQIFACTNCGMVPKELGAQLLEIDKETFEDNDDKE